MYKLIVCSVFDFDKKINDESLSSFEINQMTVENGKMYIVMKDVSETETIEETDTTEE